MRCAKSNQEACRTWFRQVSFALFPHAPAQFYCFANAILCIFQPIVGLSAHVNGKDAELGLKDGEQIHV